MLNKFPAGTRADQQKFNAWTADITELVENTYRSVHVPMDEIRRITELTAVQAAVPPFVNIFNEILSWKSLLRWSETKGELGLEPANEHPILGQHDTRFRQIIQGVTSWEIRPKTKLLIKYGAGPALQDISYQSAPYGLITPGTATEATMRLVLESPQKCNTLVWEPLPMWCVPLKKVRLLTVDGTSPTIATNIPYHGPQRFFFNDIECYGAEVTSFAPTTPGGGTRVFGSWAFDLVQATYRPSAEFHLEKPEDVTDLQISGKGIYTVTKMSDGNFVITMRTPANAPTSVIDKVEIIA